MKNKNTACYLRLFPNIWNFSDAYMKKNVTFVTISWHIDLFFSRWLPFFLKHTQPLPEISQFSGSALEH